jgi:hypothetical protein
MKPPSLAHRWWASFHRRLPVDDGPAMVDKMVDKMAAKGIFTNVYVKS